MDFLPGSIYSGQLRPNWLRGVQRKPFTSRTWIILALRLSQTSPGVFHQIFCDLDRQRSLSSNPILIKDCFQRLGKALQEYAFKPENMYNMDRRSFLLGYSNQSKVIARHRRCTPTETQDGSRERITVVKFSRGQAQVGAPPNLVALGDGPQLMSDPEYIGRPVYGTTNDHLRRKGIYRG